jgi:galactonate dehydratase
MTKLRAIASLSARVSDKTVWTFVTVEAEGGRRGWGEATLQGEADAVHREVARLRPALLGRELSPRSEIKQIAGTCGRDRAQAAAISALDQAVGDVIAQCAGQSLAAALGPAPCDAVKLYANINRGTLDRSPAGFAARAVEVKERGFDAVKIAPFDEVRPGETTSAGAIDSGLARIAAVRAAIGPDVQLLVDCHWRLTEASSHDVLREVAPLKLYWFECPLPEQPGNFDALRRLRRRANANGVRLAGCEMMTGLDGFRPYIEARIYDAIMPDVKYTGGLRELLRVGEFAAAHGVACSPHNPSGPIAHAHSLHLSAHLPSCPFLEYQYDESPLFFDFVTGALPDPRSGRSPLPQGTGLGIGIGGAALRRCVIATDGIENLDEAVP